MSCIKEEPTNTTIEFIVQQSEMTGLILRGEKKKKARAIFGSAFAGGSFEAFSLVEENHTLALAPFTKQR